MSAELRAALLRLAAAQHQRAAAQLRLAATSVIAAERMRSFGRAMQAANDTELAGHPDLAELNVRMDALYEERPA